MYAVIEVGGKQRRVHVGEVLRVECTPGSVGEAVVFDCVLAVGAGSSLHIGTPTVPGARVLGTVREHGRGEKIHIYTFKKRKNSNRRRQGHRQNFTAVHIDAIET